VNRSTANPSTPQTSRYLLPVDVPRGRKSLGQEILQMLGLTLLIFVVVQSALPNREVLGQSMEPTLQNHERLFLDGVSYFHYDANLVPRLLGQGQLPADNRYLLGGPQRGDIVVFRPPVPAQEDYIKRVIAVAGEAVEIRAYDGVYVNGHKLDEPYIQASPDYNWPAPGQAGTVPDGHVFVLGDNRRNSSDSHAWGFLATDQIVGRAWIAYWPRDLLGFLPHPAYANVTESPSPP